MDFVLQMFKFVFIAGQPSSSLAMVNDCPLPSCNLPLPQCAPPVDIVQPFYYVLLAQLRGRHLADGAQQLGD